MDRRDHKTVSSWSLGQINDLRLSPGVVCRLTEFGMRSRDVGAVRMRVSGGEKTVCLPSRLLYSLPSYNEKNEMYYYFAVVVKCRAVYIVMFLLVTVMSRRFLNLR